MKTKSVNKLALSKEVVVLLNDQKNTIKGGETKSFMCSHPYGCKDTIKDTIIIIIKG